MRACACSAGIFTAADAQQLGVDLKALQRAVAKGLIVREFRGIYRLAGHDLTPAGRALLATITTGGGVASHQTAAWLWGFSGFDQATTHVTVPYGAERQGRDWLRQHSTHRDLNELSVVHSGVRLTRPLRSALDLADQDVSDAQLEAFVAHCVSERLFTMQRLAKYLDSRKRVPGTNRIRGLDAFGCEVDSIVEAELIEVLVSHGIERPETQIPIYLRGRFVGRVDNGWRSPMVALEVDGYLHHSDVDTFVYDRDRGNLIEAAGWRLLHTTPRSIRRNPEELCATVRWALELASR
jgi:hypothetical protein